MQPVRSEEEAAELDDADREAIEKKIDESLETLTQIQVTLMNHESADEHVLQQRLERLVRGFADMHMLKDRLNVNVPEEVLAYIKDGRNPNDFTSQFMERLASENQFTNGKIAALTNFKQEYEAMIRDAFPNEANERIARSKAVYENCTVLDISGNLLFRTSRKRLDWYLSRDLATVVNDSTIQLKFANRGTGRSNEPFYLQDMRNACVVCGDTNGLTMHHVVPHQYRQYMSTDIKSRSSFDLLPVCLQCHDQYERHATLFKKHLEKCFQAPLEGRGWVERRDVGQAGRAAAALLGQYADKIPEERRAELRRTVQTVARARASLFSDSARQCIETWQGEQLDLSSDAHRSVLRELCSIEERVPGPDYCTHGEIVVGAVNQAQGGCAMCDECRALAGGGVPALVLAWRRHFVHNARPAHLPQHWAAEYPCTQQ
ncbi:hypothetical protein IWW57_004202 [Coemansia sp. S610]|nr:hypothetical protein IWW57_004202 [Coemansia sp. S610]